MGVHGLWKLIDKSGKPIPVETLENKVLAVDVSIWLYQLVRGYDKAARPGSNIFLLGLFHRICKLLFYRIRPIFVFDGGVPSLKKKTIAARQRGRKKAQESIEKVRQQLLENLIKQQALGDVLGEKVKIPRQFSSKQDELYWLPPLEQENVHLEESRESDEEDKHYVGKYAHDFSSIDVNSEEFLKLPADVRHDILTDLKETRKLNSWAKMHLMPGESHDFSNFQMERLLKRRAVQVGLEKTEQELGTRGLTVRDLKNILTEQGVDLGQRIAADSSTRFIYASIPQSLAEDETNEKADEEENSELVHSQIDLSSSSGESEDDALSIFQKIASTENYGISQQEILEMIKQNSKEELLFERSVVEPGVPGTSKQSDFTVVDQEKRSLPSGTSVRAGVNDQNVPRGNDPDAHNDESKVEPENFPAVCLQPTKEQKKCPANADKAGGVSPRVEVGSRNEPVSLKNSDFTPNKEIKTRASVSNTTNVDLDLTIKRRSVAETSQNCLEIEVNLDEPIEEDIFADVFSSDLLKPKVDKTSIVNPLPCDDDTCAGVVETASLSVVHAKYSSLSNDGMSMKPVVASSKKHLSPHKTKELTLSNTPGFDRSSASCDEEQLNTENEDFGDADSETDYFDSIKPVKSTYSELVNNVCNAESSKDLDDLKNRLEQESMKLISENKREERLSSTITEQITQDAQYLLQLFGIPYVIAPMEAEAQCAYLDLTGQTDGSISDDSDIWLFGANNVYKNFFDQRKFVKQFKSSDILECYRLKRDDLIMIAMLVGSDYTAGVSGVGPVNAIEIVAHFPSSDNTATPHQRLLKFVDSYLSSKLDQGLLRKLKSIEFSDEFPSNEVIKAYLSPTVDESKEKFSWSKPDLTKIRVFMRDKFGWEFHKTDKTLDPVLGKLSQSTTQRTIHNYFEWAFNVEEVSVGSKRVGRAVELLSGKVPSPSPPKKLRKEAPRDLLQSNYSRRKYQRYQKEKEVNEAPVLEGSRAARAAAKAIMAATKKPKPQAPVTNPMEVESASRPPVSPLKPEIVVDSEKRSLPLPIQAQRRGRPSGNANPMPAPSTSSSVPLPSLSDILCGVEVQTPVEPSSPWTPSRDLVSQYSKRKYGKLNPSMSGRDLEPERRKDERFNTFMPSKTPAQIARERAARKLKEAKQRAIQAQKSKKNS